MFYCCEGILPVVVAAEEMLESGKERGCTMIYRLGTGSSFASLAV